MIVLDDWREVLILCVITLFLLVICLIIGDATKPDCPAGSVAKNTRSGWYCTVPPVKQ
ncbi:hypothetical protein [Bradyrhizobium hipponense]|uniref:hypothetical protein n=1 Tax=Bradyrhizobium hipponense TaxID=2605638 RepID=UPI0016533086|nr:hypothetical protein [Bradyrhizobium hipponense]